MAKKKNRRPSRQAPRTYSNPPAKSAGTSTAQPASTTARTAPPSAAGARNASAAVRSTEPLSAEYAYVARDLRRLGFTALAFFAVLIAAGVGAYLLQG